MAGNLTDAQVLALNNWARTQPALRIEFDYTRAQGVPDDAPPSDGLGDRLAAPAPGSAEELATLEKQVDFESADGIIYQGWADAGTLTSEAKWRLSRAVFTSNSPNSDDVEVRFADNDPDFIHVWDDRTTLTYDP